MCKPNNLIDIQVNMKPYVIRWTLKIPKKNFGELVVICQIQLSFFTTNSNVFYHTIMYNILMYFICRWKVTKWSSCSKSCGGGHRSRNVTCKQVINIYSDPVTKDPTLCSENQPQSQEVCNHHHCYNHWHTEPWSDVSYSHDYYPAFY